MEKNFKDALTNAQATAATLAVAVEDINAGLVNAQPERVGEFLKEAVKAAGLAQLLLIDINDMIKSA